MIQVARWGTYDLSGFPPTSSNPGWSASGCQNARRSEQATEVADEIGRNPRTPNKEEAIRSASQSLIRETGLVCSVSWNSKISEGRRECRVRWHKSISMASYARKTGPAQ